MAAYRIVLLDPRGRILEVRSSEFASDDDAIDHAGALHHPNEIFVMHGGRFVVRFPPWAEDLD